MRVKMHLNLDTDMFALFQYFFHIMFVYVLCQIPPYEPDSNFEPTDIQPFIHRILWVGLKRYLNACLMKHIFVCPFDEAYIHFWEANSCAIFLCLSDQQNPKSNGQSTYSWAAHFHNIQLYWVFFSALGPSQKVWKNG